MIQSKRQVLKKLQNLEARFQAQEIQIAKDRYALKKPIKVSFLLLPAFITGFGIGRMGKKLGKYLVEIGSLAAVSFCKKQIRALISV